MKIPEELLSKVNDAEAIKHRLRLVEPRLPHRSIKKKFEHTFVQTFDQLGVLSKDILKSREWDDAKDDWRTENVTCYYLDGCHVASWSGGQGWYLYMPKSEWGCENEGVKA